MKHNSPVDTIDLSGTWTAILDPDDSGETEEWYRADAVRENTTVHLPGAVQNQGIGTLPGPETEWIGSEFGQEYSHDPRYEPYRHENTYKYPYWLQPERRLVGAVWYIREFTVPGEHVGRNLRLVLERPHWQTKVWVDGQYLGSNDSLSTPHRYDLGTNMSEGTHRIAVRVDNRMIFDVGPNAHSMTDHTQGNWNGVVGALRIEARNTVFVESARVVGNVKRHSFSVTGVIRNCSPFPVNAEVAFRSTQALAADNCDQDAPITVCIQSQNTVSVAKELVLNTECTPWDEFHACMFPIHIEAQNTAKASQSADILTVSTGLREISAVGKQLTLNGEQIFLRGTLDCCVFPLTGYPPTERAEWTRIMTRIKDFGLNHIRFHSWCPPSAAFEVADMLGMYLQVEAPVWANQGSSVGHDQRFTDWHYRETRRIIDEYGNHPSFMMMTAGNEPSGRIEEYLGLWVSHWRAQDGRRLYSSGAGWPAIEENDYHNIPEPRLQRWGEGLASGINSSEPSTDTDYTEYVQSHDRVLVSHEIGQWCVFPDFNEMPKYSGSLKPKNYEIFHDLLRESGLEESAEAFHFASGKLQLLCYKEEIEAALRTPGFGGFQLLGLSDFPGQGTALVGVLDSFWDPKTYVTSELFRSFCGPTVPLLRLSKRYYRTGDVVNARIDVSHFGPEGPVVANIHWELTDLNSTAVKSGSIPLNRKIARGLDFVGALNIHLDGITAPARYTLDVSIPEHNTRNSWDIWVYAKTESTSFRHIPRASGPGTNQHILTTELDNETLEALESGASVLYVPDRDHMRTDIQVGFSTVFWNTAWTGNQAPHTLGIVCDPGHEALAQFPTEWYSNWQWWELLNNAGAFVLDRQPCELKPIVSAIDTWFRSHRLGLLVEARVGKGKLMASSMNITHDLDHRLVARQLRVSVEAYMNSDAFNPRVHLDITEARNLIV